jgi:flavorubredoxin
MEKHKITDDLYLFRSSVPNVPVTFNQYLILGNEPLLLHTGSFQQAEQLGTLLKEILGNQKLKYIFVSHFESDECGGLGLLLKQFPDAKTICSQVTARQFSGFGFAYDIITKSPGDVLETEDFKLEFISYPSEMHMWEGLLAFEAKRGILFSSDLLIKMDTINEITAKVDFVEEIQKITQQPGIPSSAYGELQQSLLKLPISGIAPGHGPFLFRNN